MDSGAACDAVESGMTHISGHDRSQTLLLPESVDDYVGADNPVRFIDAFVASWISRRPGSSRPSLGAAAVAAGMIGEHLGTALLAVPDLATERRGAAGEDVIDGGLLDCPVHPLGL